MGLFGKSAQQKRKEFIAHTEDLAGAAQMEFYKSASALLKKYYDNQVAAAIAGALANYVFRFGYVNEQHSSNTSLMETIDRERRRVLCSFSSIFCANTTGVLILLGAAWSVNLTDFRRHMQELAELVLARVGKNTPDVSRQLPQDLSVYMYELTTL